MTRGNQREQARAKNLKKQATAKNANQMSGNDLAKHKEDARKIMMEKQAKADAKKKEAEEAELKAKREAAAKK